MRWSQSVSRLVGRLIGRSVIKSERVERNDMIKKEIRRKRVIKFGFGYNS